MGNNHSDDKDNTPNAPTPRTPRPSCDEKTENNCNLLRVHPPLDDCSSFTLSIPTIPDTPQFSLPSKTTLTAYALLRADDTLSIPTIPDTPQFSLPSKIALSPFPSTLSMISMESNRSYNNKLINRIVSDGAAQLAGHFWQTNIEPLSMEQRLEIACSLLFGMLSDIDTETRDQLGMRKDTMETTALKIFDMIGFIVRAVVVSNPNLTVMLQQLGQMHIKMGVDVEHYRVMLRHVHLAFKTHFASPYTQTVEFAMTEVFSYTAQLMTGHDMKIAGALTDLSFLRSLRCCIRHVLGREYIFKYLTNIYCDEMVVFLHLLSKFKSTKNITKRYMIAEQIAEHCISTDGYFALNLSYDSRTKVLKDMDLLKSDQTVCIDFDFFVDVEDQVCRLIRQSHWKKFKMYMNEMYCVE